MIAVAFDFWELPLLLIFVVFASSDPDNVYISIRLFL